MRVCFYTLGCKVNLNETGALEQMFRSNGFTIVQEGEPADVFVVNSCTVTNFGDQKSRKWLRRAKRENPGAVTVLTGCYPQAFPEEAAQFLEADLVCGNGDRKAILDNVLKLLDGHERIVAITPLQRGEQFDLNGLKKVNDEQGHRAGDELIVRAAGTIAGIFAEDAYRVGGDEFVVILLDVSREDFARKTEQLRRQMQENGVDASIGGVWQASTENLENLLRRADENMYREKKRYYSQADAARKPES